MRWNRCHEKGLLEQIKVNNQQEGAQDKQGKAEQSLKNKPFHAPLNLLTLI